MDWNHQDDLKAKHRRLLHMGGFTKHIQYPSLTQRDDAILDQFGHWIEALCGGQLEPFTAAQERIIRVHAGESEPETEYEQAWLAYRRAVEAAAQALMEAQRLQVQRGYDGTVTYEHVYSAYVRAEAAGSGAAAAWLHEQERAYVKPNSIWQRADGPGISVDGNGDPAAGEFHAMYFGAGRGWSKGL